MRRKYQTFSRKGRKILTERVKRYFKLAEDKLYSELAFALGKDKSDMRQLITESMKN